MKIDIYILNCVKKHIRVFNDFRKVHPPCNEIHVLHRNMRAVYHSEIQNNLAAAKTRKIVQQHYHEKYIACTDFRINFVARTPNIIEFPSKALSLRKQHTNGITLFWFFRIAIDMKLSRNNCIRRP